MTARDFGLALVAGFGATLLVYALVTPGAQIAEALIGGFLIGYGALKD